MKSTHDKGPDSREVQAPQEALFAPEFTAEQKRFSNFQASAALAGVLTWRVKDERRETYIVSSHGRTRDFTDLDVAERWLTLVTGEKSHG